VRKEVDEGGEVTEAPRSGPRRGPGGSVQKRSRRWFVTRLLTTPSVDVAYGESLANIRRSRLPIISRLELFKSRTGRCFSLAITVTALIP
jgi:hypothetical protein